MVTIESNALKLVIYCFTGFPLTHGIPKKVRWTHMFTRSTPLTGPCKQEAREALTPFPQCPLPDLTAGPCLTSPAPSFPTTLHLSLLTTSVCFPACSPPEAALWGKTHNSGFSRTHMPMWCLGCIPSGRCR